ncbi:MAG: PP2C family protein-serine/threonine phosphatase [Gammaproteobacteria bacterium]
MTAVLPKIPEAYVQPGSCLDHAHRARVLVTNDSAFERLCLAAMLSRHGYEVIEAEDGPEAIALFAQVLPDIVLLDLFMPGMDGCEAARRIKDLSQSREIYIPIIFLTASTDEKLLAACLAAGGDDFLGKPYSMVILRARIEAMLRNKAMHDLVSRQKRELEENQQANRLEMEIAEKIITNISRSAELDFGNIRYSILPVDLLSGDLIIGVQTPAKGQMFLIADFTGHGLGAAIGAMVVADVFYAMVAKGAPMKTIIAEINHKLNRILPVGRFMAACVLEIHPGYRDVSLFNAGLPDVLVRSNPVDIHFRLASAHLPLGILPNAKLDIKIEHFQVTTGDRIYVYSDGLIEVNNEYGEMFGNSRLHECLCSVADPDVVYRTILDAVDRFRGEAGQNDDICLLEIACDESLATSHSYTKVRRDQRLPDSTQAEAEYSRVGEGCLFP